MVVYFHGGAISIQQPPRPATLDLRSVSADHCVGKRTTHLMRLLKVSGIGNPEDLNRDTAVFKGRLINIREATEGGRHAPVLIEWQGNQKRGWKNGEITAQFP